MDELRRTFRPEFLNRIDEVIVFHKLEEVHLKEIISIISFRAFQAIGKAGCDVEFSENTKEYLVKEGFDLEFGALPFKKGYSKR